MQVETTSYELNFSASVGASGGRILFWERIPSQMDRVEPLLARLLHQVGPLLPSSERRTEVELALREALVNAIRHGNRGDGTKRVEVRGFQEDDGALLFVIADQGAGFDPECLPDPTAPDSLLRDCGRGLLLIRHFMDEVAFLDGGREIRLRKRV